MITTRNYFEKVKEIDKSTLPEALAKSHDFVNRITKGTGDWSIYNSNDAIRKTTDLYFEKLTEYLKESKPQSKIQEIAKKSPNVMIVRPAPLSQKPKFKAGQIIKSGTHRIEIKKVYPPGHKNASANSYFYLVDSNDFGEDVISESNVIEHSASKNAKPSKTTSKKESAKQAVERISDDVQLIKRYINLDGKSKTRDQVFNLLKSIQRAILERKVSKNSSYGSEIMQIQDSLISALKHNVQLYEIKIEKSKLEKYREIVDMFEPLTSIKLIKRYVGLQNKSGILDKAERLHALLIKFSDSASNDKYSKYIDTATENIEAYIKNVKVLKQRDAVLDPFSRTELNGLSGIKEIWEGTKMVASKAAKAGRKAFKVAKAGVKAGYHAGKSEYKKKGIAGASKELSKINIEKLDKAERREYDRLIKMMSKEEALNVIINSVDSDVTQLSSELAKYVSKHGLGFISPMIAAAVASGAAQALTSRALSGTSEVLSVSDVLAEEHELIGLTGDLQKLIGNACSPTSIMCYGRGGSGKSGLSLKIADALHAKDKRVLYVAGEQFGTPTFQELIKLSKIKGGKGFDIVKNLTTVPLESYDVIVLDSKDSLSLDVDDFKKLRKAYPDKIFILTSQGTKAGDFTGKETWRNEVECLIYCENLTASTLEDKNRWGGKAKININL